MIIWLSHIVYPWARILSFFPTIWILHYFCFVFHATAIWNARYLQAVQKDTEVKEKRQRFFSSHLFLFSDQKSKVESWSGENSRSGKCANGWSNFNELQNRSQSLNNRSLPLKNSRFLNSVNHFSHFNIGIWEIEWGWSFFSNAPSRKLKTKRRFIHDFLFRSAWPTLLKTCFA